MDIEMPGKSGLEAAEELKDSGVKIIILTTFARSGYFQRALKAGVSGYMLKDSPSDELVSAIRGVMKGRRVYAPELMEDIYSEENPLTEREKEVLELVADGKNTKEIANALSIKSGTVRNYVSMILDKLEVKNRIEAITRSKKRAGLSNPPSACSASVFALACFFFAVTPSLPSTSYQSAFFPAKCMP